MPERLLFNILEISLTMSAVTAVLMLLFPLLNMKFAAQWRHILWAMIAVRLLVPVNISLPSVPLSISVPQHVSAYQSSAFTSSADELPAGVGAIQEPPAGTADTEDAQVILPQIAADNQQSVRGQSISPVDVLVIIWLSGMLISITYLFHSYILFRKSVLRWCRPITQGQTLDIWHELRHEMDISQNISFMVCKKIQTPMMTGFFRPAILLPREDYDDTTLSAVIRHELMHCRRFDIWYKLLLRLVRAVHWFNPLVWLMVRTAESDMEASCDEAVIGKRDLNFRLQYCEAVLATVQAQNIKNNTFSTGFSGGKNSMKKRFANILNTSRKSKGKVALCLSALVIFASGTLVACNEQGKPSVSNWFDQASFAPGTVNAINAAGEPVMSYNAGNTYVLDGQGNVILTYNDETMVKAPLTLNVSELYKPGLEMPDTGFYVSAQKTAIAYGGDNEPIQVLVSDDKGATWNTYAVDNSDNSRAAKFIGFITQDDGYLVASPGSALGTSKNFVYLTSDGGKTWKETGNPNDLHSRNMTGAGFSSKDIGFIGFRVDDAVGPTIYWTQDQGKTWAKFDMKMPGQFDGYYKTPMSPVFSGNEGLWPISLRKGDDMSTIYMTSEDYGKTWRYDDSLLSKGQSISYTLITENQDFARPTYSSAWDDPLYKEQFPDASTREEVAKHMIFEMPIGAATSYPFYVDLGLDKENLNYSPNPDNIGIIIFNSRIKSVKVLGSKVAVIAAPADTGYQVIMLKRDDLPKTEAQISLMTPDGRVLDYLNMQ